MLLEILITLIVAGLVFYVADVLALPAPFPVLIKAVAVVFVLVWLLGGGLSGEVAFFRVR